MTKKIQASDYWKNSRYADLLDRAKASLLKPMPDFEREQLVRELMRALLRSENLIPEDKSEGPEPTEGPNELF